MSVIFSDFFVFDQRLDRNGMVADDAVVELHIKTVGLDGKVAASNGVLSITSLSMGQRKRLALLQSLVEDAKVCVFDELAADQDPSFKRFFYTELLPKLKDSGKIIIVISHDEQYFSTADKILHFEDGKLVSDSIFTVN